MLKARVLTAFALVIPVGFVIFFTSLANFMLFTAALFGIAAWEWGRFAGLINIRQRLFYVLLIEAILSGCAYLIFPLLPSIQNQIPLFLHGISLLAVLWWFFSGLLVYHYPKYERLWQPWVSVIGVLVLVPAWCSLCLLKVLYAEHAQQAGFLPEWLLIYSLSLVWTADIGAYFVGRRFGRKVLAKQVSPGKTVEGLVGGLLLTVIVAVIGGDLLNLGPWWKTMLLGFVVSLISVQGDLVESMMKRASHLKDSGHILPGHGGIMDRLDGVVAALPTFIVMYGILGLKL